jgi:hypothetical protein
MKKALRVVYASRLRATGWKRGAVGLAVCCALAVSVAVADSYGFRLRFQVGYPSPQTIRSPRAVSYVDRVVTARLRDLAAERVPPTLVFDAEAVVGAKAGVDGAFERTAAKATGAAKDWLETQDSASLRSVKDRLRQAVAAAMSEPIAEENAGDMARGRQRLARQVKAMPVPEAARALLVMVGDSVLRPTERYDPEIHRAQREEARARVKPVVRRVSRGDVIVRQGEEITAEHMQALKAIGLASPQPAGRRMLGVGALAVLAVIAIAQWMRRFQRALLADSRRVLLLGLLLCFPAVTVAALRAGGMRGEWVWLLFAPAAVMVTSVLLEPQVALLSVFVHSAMAGIMAGNQLGAALGTLGSGLAGLCLAGYIQAAAGFFGAAAGLAGINAALVLAIGAATEQRAGAVEAFVVAAYGFGAVAVAIGMTLILERPFDIASRVRLLELANPNQPLLKRLLVEAPGTYTDSLLIGNLAEAAAEEIGGDGLLARVGALYHDIGKMRRPQFFFENQAILRIDNVHEQLSPSLSSLIIISHVKDGVELARQHRLPRAVREIIGQHHGTDLVRYFYDRARREKPGEEVPEHQFRYPGPKPQTKEAAVVMLADACFAAVWALPQKSPARVQAVVRAIVDERLREGQLSDSPLTLRETEAIAQVFQRMMHFTLFHERPSYPSRLGQALEMKEADEAGVAHGDGAKTEPGGADAPAGSSLEPGR